LTSVSDFSSLCTVATVVRVCLNGTGGGGELILLTGFPKAFTEFPPSGEIFPLFPRPAGELIRSTVADLLGVSSVVFLKGLTEFPPPGEFPLFPAREFLSTEDDLGLPLGELANPVLSTELDLL
jgi:hypothetical protein